MRTESPKHLGNASADRWKTDGVLLPEEAALLPVDLPVLFGNDRPVEVEIGTGKGTFLLARAKARPEINFLGLEWARAYCHYSADRVHRAGLTNVRMLRADAGPLFKTAIAPQSIWRLHVYFPDPWPKRKHHKRRLLQPAFVDLARRSLHLGGQLLIVTDHLDYFRFIQSVMPDVKGFATVPFPQMNDTEGEVVGTNFERKYIAQGRPFFKLARMRYQ